MAVVTKATPRPAPRSAPVAAKAAALPARRPPAALPPRPPVPIPAARLALLRARHLAALKRRRLGPGGLPLPPALVGVKRIHPRSVGSQMRQTVALVGKAIREGATYLPLRDHAARVAAKAAPKDFRGQLAAIYADFVKRWRYVRDPRNAEMLPTTGRAIWQMCYGGGVRQGTGDCDCAAAAIGAAAHAVGFPIRLTASVPLRHAHNAILSKLPGHIYAEAYVKPIGWVALDPVVWPQHGLGHHPPALHRYRFDLWGRRLRGASLQGADEFGEEGAPMYGYGDDIQSWQDYGLAEHGYALGEVEGEAYQYAAPLDWSTYGLQGFGATADRIYDASSMGLMAEVDTDGIGLARTPMVEMRPEDIAHVRKYGRPYDGCLGLGDDGSVYQWRPAAGLSLGGFFKRIFKKVGGLVKKVAGSAFKLAKRGLKFAKKLIRKLPGGKYLVKFMDKIHKVAMKLVRPLMKMIGPVAKFLGPIAAMIPGYGPIIAVALKAGGTIANLMAKHGIRQTPKGAIIPSSAKGMAAFKAELKAQADAKRQAIAAARAAGKLDPKHVPAGTPEHVAVLRAIGLQLPKGSPLALSEAVIENARRRRKRKRKPAAAAPPEAPESQIPTDATTPTPEAAPVEFAWY